MGSERELLVNGSDTASIASRSTRCKELAYSLLVYQSSAVPTWDSAMWWPIHGVISASVDPTRAAPSVGGCHVDSMSPFQGLPVFVCRVRLFYRRHSERMRRGAGGSQS